jgi:hypothetical protein
MATPDIATIEQALLDNADYDATSSVTKARAFVTAARRWLIMSPQSSSNQSSSMSWDTATIRDMMAAANTFVSVNDSQSVRHLSVGQRFRG